MYPERRPCAIFSTMSLTLQVLLALAAGFAVGLVLPSGGPGTTETALAVMQ